VTANRLPFLAGEAQQCPVVLRAEQHEAARPRHRFEFRPGRLGVPAFGQRLVHIRLEAPQLPLEGFGDFLERLVGRPPNVVHREASVVHLFPSWGPCPELAE
jgi:hypothetical protein